ncbi:hypothetical protein N431DRAFT_460587 [Stipitochalara longipes BDJ]|nr:hypothetical protein N431DRAFT_460587 [Stipitochalara longipes BDJ]
MGQDFHSSSYPLIFFIHHCCFSIQQHSHHFTQNRRKIYQYQSLVEPDAIRLVVLQSDKDTYAKFQRSIVHTTLTACDGDVAEHYSALSYVWGDPSITTRIFTDAQHIHVTANLESALHHMRDPTRPRIVWAGGVCINQSDGEEKGRQVSSILTSWLSIQLFTWAKQRNKQSNCYKAPFVDPQQKNRQAAGFPADNHLAFRSLFNHPWFIRVLVFQEFVMSLGLWIKCRAERIRWHQTLKAFRDGVRANVLESPCQMVLSIDTAREFFHLGKNHCKRGFVASLVNMLDARRGTGVSDPRDMLFAKIRVLGKAEGSSKQRNLVDVVCTKNYTKVYTNIAKYVLCI